MATIPSELTRIKDILDATNISVTDEIEIYEYVTNLREDNKILKEKFKEIERLIDEDYFEDGSFNNEYYIREIINEALGGEDNDTNDIYRNNT